MGADNEQDRDAISEVDYGTAGPVDANGAAAGLGKALHLPDTMQRRRFNPAIRVVRARRMVLLLAAGLLFVGLIASSSAGVMRATPEPVEMKFACALNWVGLLRYVSSANQCLKIETAVTIKPGPTYTCVEREGWVRRVSGPSACTDQLGKRLLVVLPPTTAPIYFCAAKFTGVLRHATSAALCRSYEHAVQVTPNQATDTAPSVSRTSPTDSAVGVAGNANVTVDFSEPVSGTTNSFTLTCEGSPRAFSLSGSPGSGLTLDPTSDLTEGTSCTATVLANLISDTDTLDPPDTMSANYQFSFTTDSAPAVTSTNPTNNATAVDADANITIIFSEAVNTTPGAFSLDCPTGTSMSFATSGSGTATVTLDPTTDLPGAVTCKLTVIAGAISDADGGDPPDNLATNYVVTFATADVAPRIASTSPASNSTDVGRDSNVVFTFSEPVTVSSTAFKLECPTGSARSFTQSGSPGSTITLSPNAKLPVGASCTVTTLKDEVSDSDNDDPPDHMIADHTFSFSVVGNEAPTDIALSNNSIDERRPAGTTVGMLSATDPDSGQTHSFNLPVAGCGGSFPDNRSFTVASGELTSVVSFDFAVKNSYTICVRTTDNGSPPLSFDKRFTIAINDLDLPPDPSDVAPAIDPTVATSTAAATAFLYTGANPIQSGVAPDAIQPQRAAVIRGRVLTRAGDPLPAVAVSILDRPEFGHTLTRADGMFDLAVNGGGTLTVSFGREGYLSAQRQVDVRWQTYALVDDVVLVQADQRVTTIDLNATGPMQVARGSVQTDSDGTRQATLLFPPGTEATMRLPNGSTQALTSLHVRATEYTVGQRGAEAMPAALPPPSAYTYAFELNADEAVMSGATEVTFSAPLPFYVENFLGFPTGTSVPLGSYDRERGTWVPSDSGLVVKLLGVEGGLAVLDIDGTGNAASAAALAQLGIADTERSEVANLYSPGQTLWRLRIPHFTEPWDSNWGFAPAETAKPPEAKIASETPTDDPCTKRGSRIECENQILGESVAVTGTPFSLNYDSSRTLGRGAAYTLRIPLTEATVPADLVSVELAVSVGGRRFTEQFSAAPNQATTFSWDGKDAYGRTLLGKQPVRVQLGYTYPAVYTLTPRFGYSGNGIPITGDRARQEVTLTQDWWGVIGSWDGRADGLGGWSLDVRHSYDPVGQVLYLGDGRRISDSGGGVNATLRAVQSTLAVGSTPQGVAVAADGTLYFTQSSLNRVERLTPDGNLSTYAGGNPGSGGDGGPATAAGLAVPVGLALAPDGSLYIAEQNTSRVRRVAPDGTISTFAGTGVGGLSGDGGPAVQAQLSNPRDVAVGPDGSVYIADTANSRIRRVDSDGIISTFAGTFSEFGGDGGPATSARLTLPTGLEVAQDGTVYIADTANQRVRKVTPDGIITTVAGNGFRGSGGDGGPALQASFLDPTDVAMRRDGSLLIVDSQNSVVRQVTTDGTISRTIGTGRAGISGEGGPAAHAQLFVPQAVTVAPDGAVYVADTFNQRIVKMSSPFPGFSDNDIAIPSRDGSELYQLDAEGRHLRTLDTLTGVTLYRFAYDSDGRLMTITDRDGNTVSVDRDSAGLATGIVGPYGQRTELTTTPDGYLFSIAGPAGDTVRLGYGTSGLLETLTDPRGGVHAFTYDLLGRLAADQDPTGATQHLARTDDAVGYTVTLTSALGHATRYRIERLPGGGQAQTITDPAGLVTSLVNGNDGARALTEPDGTNVKWQLTGDPRFGMLAPVVSTRSTVAPSGLTRSERQSVSVTLGDPADPLSLNSLTVIAGTNGRDTTTAYAAATRTIVTTSPAGRQVSASLDAKARLTLAHADGFGTLQATYDNRGRMETLIETAGTQTRTTALSYGADGLLESVTDPLGRTVGFTRDAVGRVTSQTLPGAGTAVYGYDANSNLSSVTPPGRSAHTFGYTPVDLPASYTPPDLPIGTTPTDYSYNADRQLTRITWPDATLLDVGHDAAGRLGTVTLPRGSIRYGYDLAGRLADIRAPSGLSLIYGYDGGLVTSSTAAGAVSGSVSLTYDTSFRLSAMSLNGLEPVGFGYDADDLLERAGALTLDRDAQTGLLTSTALGMVTDTWTYNGFAEQTNHAASINGNAQFSGDYTQRDALGRITTKIETLEGRTDTYVYTYDTAGRLTDVQKNGEPIEAYTYDANGNRLSATLSGVAITGAYDSQDRMTRHGATTYSYTAAGALATKTIGAHTTTYSYDQLGNLLGASLPDGTAIAYLIDGQNRRTGKKVDGLLLQGFVYEAGRRAPIAELGADGMVVSRFIYATDVNVPDYMVKAGVTYRIVTDELGSPRLVANAETGAIIQRLDYDTFGNVVGDTSPGFQPFGFAGGIYDPDTRFVRFGGRDYEAETGRWTAKDPAGFAGGDNNLYAYVANDPVNFVDPDGELKISAAFRKKFPKSSARLDSLGNKLNDQKLRAFRTNGKASSKQVKEALAPGNGPACMSKDLGSEGTYGEYDKKTQTITINERLLKRIENGENQDVLFDSTVEHELVHHFDNVLNNNGSKAEEGEAYEKDAYGCYPAVLCQPTR